MKSKNSAYPLYTFKDSDTTKQLEVNQGVQHFTVFQSYECYVCTVILRLSKLFRVNLVFNIAITYVFDLIRNIRQALFKKLLTDPTQIPNTLLVITQTKKFHPATQHTHWIVSKSVEGPTSPHTTKLQYTQVSLWCLLQDMPVL